MENLEIDISLFRKKYAYLLASWKFNAFSYLIISFSFFIMLFNLINLLNNGKHFFISSFLMLLSIFLMLFFAGICDKSRNLKKQIDNLNGEGNQNLNSAQRISFRITLNENGYVKLPYQRLVPNLIYNDMNGEITDTLLYQYDSTISSDERDFYICDLEDDFYYYDSKENIIMKRLSDFCNQEPKTIISNIKRMKLTNKEMIDLINNLYEVKKIKYKNDIIDNIFKENKTKQVYQEKNIHSQIDDELAKVRKKLKD